MDTGSVRVEFGSCSCSWQRPRESPKQESYYRSEHWRPGMALRLATRVADFTAYRGQADSVRDWNMGARGTIGSGGTVANPKVHLLLSFCWLWTYSFQNLLPLVVVVVAFKWRWKSGFLCDIFQVLDMCQQIFVCLFICLFLYRPSITYLWASLLILPVDSCGLRLTVFMKNRHVKYEYNQIYSNSLIM